MSQALGDDLADYMTAHYETFITERDFADIAAAGMNWIRLPVPFWIVETVETEPYLEGVAWNYMIQAFGESKCSQITKLSANYEANEFLSQNGLASTVFV